MGSSHELSQVVRQKDPEFVEILNAVREGENDTALIEKLNTRNIPAPVGNECITLVTSNSAASIINHRKLEELDTEEYLYTGLIEGTYEKDDLPTNMILCLKEGAQVILLKNNPGKWVNGTIGKIVKLEQNQIIIQTPDGEFPVGKEMWTKYEYQFNEEKKQMERVPVGYFTQYPLKLSYAITIHKSQGQTYECVEVDYSVKRAFAPGQTYVALSRCKHFSSLYLTVPMIQDDIKADEEVVRFMHGEFEARPRSNVPAPIVEHTRRPSEYRFRDDHRIEAKDFGNHKKITGTRLANILNMTEKISPFAMWCAMMHVYEEPYKDTIFTRAGETIEPKQFEYVKKLFAKEGRVFISPTDRYGEEYKLNTHYDFFRQTERFGGMWDYLLERDNKVVMVFEMKTTGIGNKEYWMKHLPQRYIIQAALYAWLLKIDYFCMVCSFLEKDDYDAPENYVCNEENTITRIMKVSEYFQDFDKQIIVPAMQWWDDYIETGISPEYDEVRDHDILEQLRKGPDEEEIDEDEYYDQLAEYHGYRNDGFISSSRDLYSLHLDKNYHDMTYYKRKKQEETDN